MIMSFIGMIILEVKQKYLTVLLHFIKKPGLNKNACHKNKKLILQFLRIVYFANIYLVNKNFTRILLNIMANMFCFIPITFGITTGLTSFKGQCCILILPRVCKSPTDVY